MADPTENPPPDPFPPHRPPPPSGSPAWPGGSTPPPDQESPPVRPANGWRSPAGPGPWPGTSGSPAGPDPWPGAAGSPAPGPAPPPWATGEAPPEPGTPSGPRRPGRNPLPKAAGSPRVLRLELGLVLLLAFAPGILGLLILALGTVDTTDVQAQLVPALVSAVFELFLSWSPVLVIAYLLIRSGEGWAGIGLTRFRAGDAGQGALLWVASFALVFVLAQVFSYFGQREVDFLPEALPLWFRILQAVMIATTAGATEEIVVRGYAQTRLEQLRAPTAVIVLLPTALWGFLHIYQGLGAGLTIFCLGLMYALYFQRTRRLWPLILAHGLFDMTQLVLILAGA